MSFHRKPVPLGPRPMKPSHTEATGKMPTARPMLELVQGPDDAEVNLNRFSANDLAPALALMDVTERSHSVPDNQHLATSPTRLHAERRRIPRSSLDKPLPETPDQVDLSEEQAESVFAPAYPVADVGEGRRKNRSKHDSARELGVENILDLNDSEDTIYYRRQAPAVTHETITQPVHTIQHEVHERDIHEHEVYHRILPVQEVEVLPARHFVEDVNGRRHEVSADEVPGRSPQFTDRLLEEVFKLALPEAGGSERPRKFTARRFTGTEGDAKKSIGATGTVHTEQWWVHPPALEQSGLKDKEVYPVSVG